MRRHAHPWGCDCPTCREDGQAYRRDLKRSPPPALTPARRFADSSVAYLFRDLRWAMAGASGPTLCAARDLYGAAQLDTQRFERNRLLTEAL